MRKSLVMGMTAFVLVGLAAPAVGAVGQTIDGTVVLKDGFGTEGQPCAGSGKFADIKPGATVRLRNAKKTVVGTGTLGQGTWTASIPGSDFVDCEFPFTVDVPTTRSYSVQVAKRKAGTVTRKALAANSWVLEVTVGD